MILSLLIVILITFLAHPEASIAFFFGGAKLRKDGWNLPTMLLTFNHS